VPLIIGFAAAFDQAQSRRAQTIVDLTTKREDLLAQFQSLPYITPHAAHARQVLPNIVNFNVAGKDGEWLVLELDKLGFQVATGAACSAGTDGPSHVLQAIGLAKSQAQSSLRVSFGAATTKQDLKGFTQALAELL
jgi:cysteine desulfurase